MWERSEKIMKMLGIIHGTVSCLFYIVAWQMTKSNPSMEPYLIIPLRINMVITQVLLITSTILDKAKKHIPLLVFQVFFLAIFIYLGFFRWRVV